MCDFLVEIAISETYLKLQQLAATECPQIMKSEKNMPPK
jgi:hypothetical protein